MNKLTHLTFILCLLTFSISAQITGTVFRDYNGDGLKGSLEPLVAGILVTAYNSSGVQCGTTQTTTNVASPNYTLTGCTGIVRIEFAMPAKIATMNLYPNSSSDFSSSNGGTYGSSVQFLSNGASGTANYAISNPEDYWNNTTQPNPGFIVPRYVNGTSASNTAEKGLVFVDNNDNGLTPVVEEVANLAEVGSVWGTAFQRSRNRMFYSAFTKRHVGFGPEGEGGIYISDGTSMTNYSITGSFTLQGVTPSNGGSAIDLGTVTRNSTPGDDNYLIADKTQPSRDLDAFAKVGRTSYGDADFDEATQKLYIVNLNQRTIIEVDASGTTASLNSATPAQLGALTRSFSIASLPGVPSCTNGTLRPFALKIYRGKGYLGVICDASTSQNKADLSGYVLQFDLANIGAGFTTVISLPNFNTTTWRNNDINIEWKPWITNWAQTGRPVPTGFVGAFSHTQPVLSDIEFDEKGGLSMNLMSLWGHQVGVINMVPVSGNSQLMNSFSYGDIIYACYNPTTDAWTMEGSAGCSVNHTANTFATGSNQLLSYSGTGSYYNDRSGDGSIENGMGGLAQIKGSQRVVNVVVDPYPYQTPNIATYQNTGGLHWYVSNTDVGITNGIWDNWVQLYGQNAPQNFGKAHGLGDIESVLTPAPIEIGNRVWNDIDSDGIQDAGEAPIQGVTVQLVNSSGIVIATASTDASGNYYFSSGTGMSTTSSIYNITQLLPNMEYIVRIPNVTGGSKQAALGLNSLTTANAGGGTPGTQPDVRDSDGSIVGVNAEATVLTTQIPVSGANNHTFDFGFAAAACNIISITALPGSCNTLNNQYTLTGVVTFTDPPMSGKLFITVPGGGSQMITGPFVSPINYSISGLVSDGMTHTVTATFELDTACSKSTTYSAPISCNNSTCNCSDYIYLNDVSNFDGVNGYIHKFRVNADGSVTEMPNGTTGTLPWFPVGGGLPNPHGLGQDLNANLYIGEFASGDIRKLTCNGTLLPESQYVVPFSSGLNIGSTSEGVLYTNPNGTSYPDNAIAAFDICSGTNLGYVLLGGYTDRDWGMFVAPDGTIYSTQADDPWPNSEPKWIWRYKPTSADLIAHTVYAPFVDIDAAVVPLGIDNTSFQIMGITVDNVGNMYVVAWDFETTGSRRTWILKFNSLGTLVDSAFEDEDANTIGYDGSFGIVYDATLNRLYLSGLDDCIAIVDTDLNYVGTGIGHVPSSTPKGIAMARECCPPSVTTTLDTLICASIGDKLFLSQLTTTCDGPICGGTWTPSGSNVGITFNACDNSIIINNPDIACGTFTLSSVGGANTTCGTFTYILNINVGRITGPSISGSQLLCPIDVPAQLTSSGGTGSEPLTYQWQQSSVSCTAGFTDISGAISSTYSPPSITATQYFRLISRAAGNCLNGEACRDTSNCITLTLNTNCLTCTATETHTAPVCNNNGTPAISTDDWFTLNVTGTITDGSGNYIVTIPSVGYTSAITSSGIAINIVGNGVGANPLLRANGSSTYTVRISDATDTTCFTEFVVGPVASCSTCPNPNCTTVTIIKN